jgi:hypothetical protein
MMLKMAHAVQKTRDDCRFSAETLQKLQCMSVSLSVLELLKVNVPVKSREIDVWKFEKAHSILHKVRELLLFGWSKNISTQGPEQ